MESKLINSLNSVLNAITPNENCNAKLVIPVKSQLSASVSCKVEFNEFSTEVITSAITPICNIIYDQDGRGLLLWNSS